MRGLRAELSAWFARERRDLPWRRTRDPYAIWVSETMLQQTRVEVVRDYHSRFLERFPDVSALAEARVEDVLGLWSGLGYYRRARALHAAARAVVGDHGGELPRTADELRRLPGVGRYTAGAVLSIAFDAPEPAVDGNVTRVLCRLFALDDPPNAARERAVWRRAGVLLPERSPGEWNQALMELGALVCLPRTPRCEACPLSRRCRARAAGTATELPRRAAPRPPVEVDAEALLIEREGRVLLLERPPGVRMAGLLELPTRERGSQRIWPRAHRVRAVPTGPDLALATHAITHHRIRARLLPARLAKDADVPDTARAALHWAAPGELGELALTGLTRKLLRGVEIGGSLGG